MKFLLKQSVRFKEYFPEGSAERKHVEDMVSSGNVEHCPKIEKATIEGSGDKVFIFEAIETDGTIVLDYETFVS